MPYIEKISITFNPLIVISERAFEGLNRLHTLNLTGNSIQTLKGAMFSGLARVKINTIILAQNNIKAIFNRAFQELGYLQILDLSGNSLNELKGGMFFGLRLIRKLFLFNNDINNIETNAFNGMMNLDTLSLNGNSLKSVNKDMFGLSLPKLRKLLLSKNNIKTLSADSFASVPNLEYLSLSHNEITIFEDNTFQKLSKLRKLHIGHNLVVNFDESMMNDLEGLTEFLFDHNKITFIPDCKHQFPNLIKTAVEGNPWQCPCLDEIIKFLEQKKVTYRKQFYFEGTKPVCVATSSKTCVKDFKFTEKERVVDTYESIADNSDSEKDTSGQDDNDYRK